MALSGFHPSGDWLGFARNHSGVTGFWMAGVSLGRLPTFIGAVERWYVRFTSGKSCSPLLRFSFTAGRRSVFPDKQPIAESLHGRGRRNGYTE